MSIPLDEILTIKLDKDLFKEQCYNQINVDSHFTHKNKKHVLRAIT